MTTQHNEEMDEVSRQVRLTRWRQDEAEILHMVSELVHARKIDEAVAVLEAYGNLLVRRPQMLEELPPL